MNKSDYISDGIIESYVLGFITPEDKEELDRLMVVYPELAMELAEVERRIEAAALKIAPVPPYDVRQRLIERIMEEEMIREREKIFVNVVNVRPSKNKITVHVGFKVFFIIYLGLMVLALLAILLYSRLHLQ